MRAVAVGVAVAILVIGVAWAGGQEGGTVSGTGTGTAKGTGTETGSGNGSGAGSGSMAGAAAGAAVAEARRGEEAEGVTIPAGWRPLAELAGAIPTARGAPVVVEARKGWGDPAHGCFALMQRVSAPAKGFHLGRTQAALLQAMQATGFTAGPNAVELPFVGRGVQGRMRSSTLPEAQDRIAVVSLACFYNGREPDRCQPMCDAMLDSVGTGR